MDEDEQYDVLLNVDQDHVGHIYEVYETVYDNPVEYVEWAHCYDCDVSFKVTDIHIV